MSLFKVEKFDFKDSYIISDFCVRDNRGGFTKCFEKNLFEEAGIPFSVNEVFFSRSHKNVIRGLHFQLDMPQAKLVSVIAGCVWDVIVDLRPNSSTFSKWRAVELSEDNHLSLLIPRGCAHGFVCLEDNAIMLYQCDGKYIANKDAGIRYNDPDIGIEWPIDIRKAIISSRDLNLMSFQEYKSLVF